MIKWWKAFGLGIINDVGREIAHQNWFISFNYHDRNKCRMPRLRRGFLRIKYNTYKSIFGYK